MPNPLAASTDLDTAVAPTLASRDRRARPAASIWIVNAYQLAVVATLLLRRPMFALSTVTALGSFATQGLAFVSLPFYFEEVLHRSPVDTGFLMTPWPAIVALAAPFAGRLSDRHPPGLLGGVGLALLSAGMASLALLPPDPGVTSIVLRMALCGAGFGFFQSPNLKALIRRHRRGGEQHAAVGRVSEASIAVGSRSAGRWSKSDRAHRRGRSAFACGCDFTLSAGSGRSVAEAWAVSSGQVQARRPDLRFGAKLASSRSDNR